ncbi:MAG: element excision factor XisH family protein [Cyanobacteria bacterium P01_G01_bin.54]
MYHDTVKAALIKDGWTITEEPFSLEVKSRDLTREYVSQFFPRGGCSNCYSEPPS